MEHPILEKIDAYCQAAGIAESTLGNLAAKDSRVIRRIREGRATLQLIGRLEQWMEEHPARERPRAGKAA